jgi:hypothetical protein
VLVIISQNRQTLTLHFPGSLAKPLGLQRFFVDSNAGSAVKG